MYREETTKIVPRHQAQDDKGEIPSICPHCGIKMLKTTLAVTDVSKPAEEAMMCPRCGCFWRL